ncbi:MAG: GNAT family N-acetyltransferase [Deltaproteobacteria bacterium]|nr:GNAT family N-acetyltransferase [Deltaproteobacteria bacterium]
MQIIDSKDRDTWREALAPFEKVDVCHLPEYHDAYSTRFLGSRAMLWSYRKNNDRLAYPFLLSPIILQNPTGPSEPTEYFDIGSIYGYSGPLSTSSDKVFLTEAWSAFDQWAIQNRIICEFVRFSVFADNARWAHPDCQIENNRSVAFSLLPHSKEEYFDQLPSKTRNMIRRAQKEGFTSREITIGEGLNDFRTLYRETIARNQAAEFFSYNDDYYERLLRLPEGEFIICGVYKEAKMVSAAIALAHRGYALYHLGANDSAASRLGAGNFALFEIAQSLIQRGVRFFNIGGGRTTDPHDPLLSFKKSNGTAVGEYKIGKRVLERRIYDSLAERWQAIHGHSTQNQLQFYR